MTIIDDMEACAASRSVWLVEEANREPDEQDPVQRAFGAGFFEGNDYGFNRAVKMALVRIDPKEVCEIFGLKPIEVVKMKAGL